MRLFWLVVACAVLAGCASAKRPEQSKGQEQAKHLELRGATREEQAKVDEVLLPLVSASDICQPREPCTIGLAVEPQRSIHVAAGPAPPKKFVLLITTGALKDLKPSELQAALAHELGHIQLGHFESRDGRRRAALSGEAAPAEEREQALRANRAADREEEFAADRYAVELLDRLPGSPGRGCKDMLHLVERLDLEELTPGWTGWLATHPTPAARLKAIQAECDKKS